MQNVIDLTGDEEVIRPVLRRNNATLFPLIQDVDTGVFTLGNEVVPSYNGHVDIGALLMARQREEEAIDFVDAVMNARRPGVRVRRNADVELANALRNVGYAAELYSAPLEDLEVADILMGLDVNRNEVGYEIIPGRGRRRRRKIDLIPVAVDSFVNDELIRHFDDE